MLSNDGASMKELNDNGYLEPGLHEMTLEELEDNFVKAFPGSATRADIMRGYVRHQAELGALRISVTQFVDGSFVTSKLNPGDVDLVCFMEQEEVDRLPREEQLKLEKLVSGPATKDEYCCDAYFAPVVPKTHPKFNECHRNRTYWLGEFGFDREDRPKGIAVLTIPEATE